MLFTIAARSNSEKQYNHLSVLGYLWCQKLCNLSYVDIGFFLSVQLEAEINKEIHIAAKLDVFNL